MSSKCSTRDKRINAKESSTAGSYHKGSNSVNHTSQSCHNGDIFSDVAASNHNGSSSAMNTPSCHKGDILLEATVSGGDTTKRTFNHNTCIFKKRFINRKAGIRNFYGRPHNAFTKHVDSNFMKNAVAKSGKTCAVAEGGGFPPPQQPSITNEGKSSVQRTPDSSLCRGQDPQHARVNRKFDRPKLAEHNYANNDGTQRTLPKPTCSPLNGKKGGDSVSDYPHFPTTNTANDHYTVPACSPLNGKKGSACTDANDIPVVAAKTRNDKQSSPRGAPVLDDEDDFNLGLAISAIDNACVVKTTNVSNSSSSTSIWTAADTPTVHSVNNSSDPALSVVTVENLVTSASESPNRVQRTPDSSLCRGQDPQHARVNRKFERPKLAEHKLLDANMANVSHRFINSTDNVNIVHSNKHLNASFMHDMHKAKITDKTFRDDHRDINKLLVKTGNDIPVKDGIGAHNLPSSCVSTAGGRVFTRENKETKDNKSPISPLINVHNESFVNKRRRLLCTPTAPNTFGGTNILHDPSFACHGPTNLLQHSRHEERNSLSRQACARFANHAWLDRMFHPPDNN